MKYRITCEELNRYTTDYIVEAENEKEAEDFLYADINTDVYAESFEFTEQRDIINIEPYETN